MKYQKGIFLIAILILSAIITDAQTDMVLECPLANGAPKTLRASDKDYQYSSESGVIFTSKTDTSVLACHNALVVIVARSTEDKTYDIVLQFKQYYFWYTGVVAPKVKSFAQVKPGDVIGVYKPGSLLEVTMYLQEDPVNLRKYMKCK